MGKVRIITDSNAALSAEVVETYSIEVIPQQTDELFVLNVSLRSYPPP